MSQPTLFDQPTAAPGAVLGPRRGSPRVRHTDPVTSRQAAASLTPDMLGHEKARVLRAIAMHEGAAIRDQIAGYLSAEKSCVSRRITDLVEDGLVVDSGYHKPGNSGRYQIVWQLTDAGRERAETLR